MNNYEYLKNINIEQMGHFLCSQMDEVSDRDDYFPCECCPMREKCDAGQNGWLQWLKEEKK